MSPIPWVVVHDGPASPLRIEDATGRTVAHCGAFEFGYHQTDKENAQAIVALVDERETLMRAVAMLRSAIESALACGCDGDWQSAERGLRAAINKPRCERCGGREVVMWMTTSADKQERGEYPCPLCCPIDYAEHKRCNP